MAVPGCQMGSFMDRGFPRGFYQIVALTEELRRGEKEAYGKLIRMMAHEVNNTAGAVGSLLRSCLTAHLQSLNQPIHRLRLVNPRFEDATNQPDNDDRIEAGCQGYMGLDAFDRQHGAFDLSSLGADGREGGEGEDRDIVSW